MRSSIRSQKLASLLQVSRFTAHSLYPALFFTDTLAHTVIPAHPALKPHARMLHHFRFILPLLNSEDDEFTPLHYYDSAIQLARNAAEEPTEEEFLLGMQAVEEIRKRCVSKGKMYRRG